MMLQVTLVTDGSSDVALVPILEWLIRQLTHEDFEIRWADLRGIGDRPHDLARKLTLASREYPCRLLEALRTASGTTGRRARRFKPGRAARRLANLVTDWSPLRQLAAFARLERDTAQALARLGVGLTETP